MNFPARYPGFCAECEEHFDEGTPIEFYDFGIRHAGKCPSDRKPAEVCTVCWLEKPCGCEE